MTTERKATLIIEGREPVEFPIMTPVHGNDCIDIRALSAKTGLFTYDSGFLSTAACQSAFDLARDVPTCSGARDGTCLTTQQIDRALSERRQAEGRQSAAAIIAARTGAADDSVAAQAAASRDGMT